MSAAVVRLLPPLLWLPAAAAPTRLAPPTPSCAPAHLCAEAGEDSRASGRKKKRVKVGGGMRRTRGMIEAKARGPKLFR